MLQKLIDLFAGKKVSITHRKLNFHDVKGICKTIHAVPGSESHFNIELENGNRYGFVPETQTPTSVEGKLHRFTDATRKIELV